MRGIEPLGVRMVAVMPKHFKASDEAHLAHYWRAREQIRNQWFRGFTKTLKRQFAAEQGTVVNSISSSDLSTIEDEVRSALNKGRKKWETLFNGLYIGMAQDIAPMILQQYEGETGKSYRPASSKADDDLWMRFLMRYLKRAVPPKVDGLLQTSWDGITSQISDGVENGEGMDDIFERINSLYGDRFSTTRSMTIARTEVTAASNIATQKTGEYAADRWELDIVKKWLTARDNSVRDSHIGMEGVEVDLDNTFNVNGSELLCPGDTTYGADLSEIINCRCDVAQSVRDT